MTAPARVRPTAAWAAAVAVAVLAAACALPGPRPPDDARPRSDAPLPPPPLPEERIPSALAGPPRWQAPFSSPPKAVEDGFVGLVMPEGGGDLTVLGIGTDGAARWSTTRNPSCTAFAVTRGAGGRELVVLLDSDADPDSGAAAVRTTAAAYDPADGALVWGPVDVPGTLAGPGLVFAATAGSVMGPPTGPKTALDPATGRVAADEESGVRVRHEHHGVVLTEDDRGLRALDSAGGAALWEGADLAAPASPAGTGPLRAHYGPRPGTDSGPAAVLEWRDRNSDPAAYTVHDVRTGRRLTELSAASEPGVIGTAQGRAVVRGTSAGQGTGVLAAVEAGRGSAAPRLLWTAEDPGERFRMAAIADGVLYLVDDASARALDMSTGRTLGEGTWAVPVAAAGGIALVPIRTDGPAEAFAAVPRAP